MIHGFYGNIARIYGKLTILYIITTTRIARLDDIKDKESHEDAGDPAANDYYAGGIFHTL